MSLMKLLKTWFVVCVLFVIWLAGSWSLLRPGLFRVHDYIHAARIAEMTRGLQEGQFPVRWSPNFGFGYGMPLFEFYAPLPYLVGSAGYWLTGNLLLSVKLLFVVANLGTLFGGYLLGRQLGGRTTGLVLAASLTLAPYRAVNLFVRGAVSEAWGIMALPWIVWGIFQVITEMRLRSWKSAQVQKGLLAVWLGLVVLLLSHNLTALLFVPMSLLLGAGYLLVTMMSQKNSGSVVNFRSSIESIGLLGAAYALAIGATTFYWLPALVEKQFVKLENILGGYFHYSQHFLYLRQFFTPGWGFGGSQWGPEDGISFFLGYGQWLGLLTLGVAVGRVLWKRAQHRQWSSLLGNSSLLVSVLVGGLLVVSTWLSTFKSEWLWDALPAFSFIQFPWRWLSVSIVWVAILNGLAVALHKKTIKRYLIGGALILVILANAWYFQPESLLEDAAKYYYSDPIRIQSEMSLILPDYIPKDMSDQPELPPAAAWSHREGEGLDPKLEVLVRRGHQVLLKTEYETPTEVQFAIAPFPGWRVELDGQTVEGLERLGLYGNLALEVPAGEHLVGVILGNSPVRTWSDRVSLLSWTLVIIWCLELLHLKRLSPKVQEGIRVR